MEPLKEHKPVYVETKDVGSTIAAYMAIHSLDEILVHQRYDTIPFQNDKFLHSTAKIIYSIHQNLKKMEGTLKGVTITIPEETPEEEIRAVKARLSVFNFPVNLVKVNYNSEYVYGPTHSLLGHGLNISYFNHDQTALRDHLVFISPDNDYWDEDIIRYYHNAVRDADISFVYNWRNATVMNGHRMYEASGFVFEVDPKYRVIDAPLPQFHYYFPWSIEDERYMFPEFISDLPKGTIVAILDEEEILGENFKVMEKMVSPFNDGVTLLKMDPRAHDDLVKSIILENEEFRKKDKSSKFKPLRQIVLTNKLSVHMDIRAVEMYSIAYPKGLPRTDVKHFKTIPNGITEFQFEEESIRALGRK